MGQHDFATRSCCDLGLQGSNPNVTCDTLSQYGDHSCNIRLQIIKLWAGNYFAERSYCDFKFQSSNPNVVRETSSQYGDTLCEIVLNRTSNNELWAEHDYA